MSNPSIYIPVTLNVYKNKELIGSLKQDLLATTRDEFINPLNKTAIEENWELICLFLTGINAAEKIAVLLIKQNLFPKNADKSIYAKDKDKIYYNFPGCFPRFYNDAYNVYLNQPELYITPAFNGSGYYCDVIFDNTRLVLDAKKKNWTQRAQQEIRILHKQIRYLLESKCPITDPKLNSLCRRKGLLEYQLKDLLEKE